MLLYFIRHGDPIYNPDSLTPLGERQAEAVAKRLALFGVNKIYASTSNRAILTATLTLTVHGTRWDARVHLVAGASLFIGTLYLLWILTESHRHEP